MVLATGYLYGFTVGILVTMTAAATGIFIAHLFNKAFLTKYIERVLVNQATEGSLLSQFPVHLLLSSKQNAFQLAFLARLTPIPFGIQNSVFALSSISTRHYIQASVVGMLPCQAINVYLGSTVRSMEEVWYDFLKNNFHKWSLIFSGTGELRCKYCHYWANDSVMPALLRISPHLICDTKSQKTIRVSLE